MGQQQLILLVLATVIVGIAIVVGITAFSENSAKSNADAMMQDAVRIANDIQAWGQKPSQFGGPAAGEDFTNVTFGDMAYEDDGSGNYTNLNGTFTLTPNAGVDVLVTGQSFVEGTTTVRNEVQVIVCGTQDEDDIVGSVMIVREEPVGTAPACPTTT